VRTLLSYLVDREMEHAMTQPADTRITAKSESDRISVELSSRRTAMSFQRTRLSADRTLMSVIRTSLSLISFGFTIYQGFAKAHQAGLLDSSTAARTFGQALVLLGTLMLGLGIVYHVGFMLELRNERAEMSEAGLLHGEGRFPVSLTLITAVTLLVIGLFAFASTVFGVP
jgi:putative membrane protein